MASVQLHLSLLILLIQASLSLSSPLILPISKHPHGNQHVMQLFHTSQLLPTTLLLDLNSPFLWLGVSSPNHFTIPYRSIQCSAAGSDQHMPPHDHCMLTTANSLTGESATGELVQDVVGFGDNASTVDEFLYVSAPSVLLTGLAGSVKGVFGLGKSRVGVAEQISHSFNLPKKFSLCLSSSASNGMALFGDNQRVSASKSLIYTPLLDTHSYIIALKALIIQNTRLPVSVSTVRISTSSPYTLMDMMVYSSFIQAFTTAAASSGMERAASVGPFEVCYNTKGYEHVPVIEMVLQSEMVRWKIHGHNSMVKVNDEVMCLGILNGGLELGASIVLGSHQLEDNLLEFDVGSSMLGFSSSLSMKETSCSQLTASALRKDVQSMWSESCENGVFFFFCLT